MGLRRFVEGPGILAYAQIRRGSFTESTLDLEIFFPSELNQKDNCLKAQDHKTSTGEKKLDGKTELEPDSD